MKVVIADDEVLVRKGISMSIPWQELGVDQVFEAGDGQQAMEIIESNPIDILLTDIRMPKMDGLELLKRVSVISPHTVNIVLSCVNDMECVREAMKFNKAVDYIPKLTMSTDELTSVIRRAQTFVKDRQEDSHEKEESLPLFFRAESEARLRRGLEYETKEELWKILRGIFTESRVLGTAWRKSTEWEEIVGVFASAGKKYGIYEKDYLAGKLERALKQAAAQEELEKEILNLASEMKERIEEEKRKSYDTGIRAALEYMDLNYKKNLKLGEVAEHVGMSESYFSRYFKRVMGEGFSEYLNKIRVEKAKDLLKEQRITMQETAERVGYSNGAYFTRIFKNLTGMSPKAFQKKISGGQVPR
nr:helix-turn-helix domain-containing protein [uncultured Blautia sp.]